ncbi:hypothetical protein BHE74_00046449 [Ensete ventricosum]|nr:hypothetical protein BHE74_00046449 [Ensete ventricosum]
MTTCFKTDGSRRLMATTAYHVATTSRRAPQFGTRVSISWWSNPFLVGPAAVVIRNRPGRPSWSRSPPRTPVTWTARSATRVDERRAPARDTWTIPLTRHAPVGREGRRLFLSQHLPHGWSSFGGTSTSPTDGSRWFGTRGGSSDDDETAVGGDGAVNAYASPPQRHRGPETALSTDAVLTDESRHCCTMPLFLKTLLVGLHSCRSLCTFGVYKSQITMSVCCYHDELRIEYKRQF